MTGIRAMTRQLHLNLFIHSRGHHEASWRHPAASPLALTDIRYYQDLAQRAEAAAFASIFLADQLALGEAGAQADGTWLEIGSARCGERVCKYVEIRGGGGRLQ